MAVTSRPAPTTRLGTATPRSRSVAASAPARKLPAMPPTPPGYDQPCRVDGGHPLATAKSRLVMTLSKSWG